MSISPTQETPSRRILPEFDGAYPNAGHARQGQIDRARKHLEKGRVRLAQAALRRWVTSPEMEDPRNLALAGAIDILNGNRESVEKPTDAPDAAFSDPVMELVATAIKSMAKRHDKLVYVLGAPARNLRIATALTYFSMCQGRLSDTAGPIETWSPERVADFKPGELDVTVARLIALPSTL